MVRSKQKSIREVYKVNSIYKAKHFKYLREAEHFAKKVNAIYIEYIDEHPHIVIYQ